MTTITRERLLKIQQWRETYGPGSNVVLPAEEAEELARIALASLEAEPVAYIIQDSDARSRGEKGILRYFANISDEDINEYEITVTPLYTAPPAPEDYFSSLVSAARLRADKAMRKFPQPNYVLNKVAKESGEVIKEVIHYTEGRGDWNKVEYELIDNLAMLIRLVTEGDQVIGFTPPDVCRGAKGSQLVSNRDELLPSIKPAPELDSVAKNAKLLPSKYPVIPDEVLSAIRKVARIRTDFDHFDGDRRGIADCLDEAEQELIVTINEHAAMLQGAPVQSSMPDGVVTAEQRRVIEMLLNVCGAAFELADDSCQQDVDGEECHVVPDDAFQKLSDALDEIENTLPTEDVDRPDVFLAWSAMPRAALKSILQAGNSPVIPDGLADTKRLDWLDAQNKRLNEYYGTSYGWKFDANFQRNAMMLNDSNYPVMTVRQAIDQAITAAPQQENT